ncbi:MAG: hypothetical protein HKN70_08870 [Gammaproteobacteria bacterium]|nr:hypothetical protein [Gammaproteobacteria bacterium]
MRISQGIPLALVTGIALALSGCSGSGSSATSTPDVVQQPVPPATPTAVISGFVTDMPIPNATVIVTVNGQSFQAPLPTAADGSYQVEIQSDDPDALVTAEAFDPNGPVRFTAVIDTFSAIEDAAGDSMATDINITNVTTAQQILATRLTTDGSIDSKDELVDAAARVDTDDLLDLSAAIKVVVESIGGVTLPVDVTDTLALAHAIVDNTTTFLDDVAVTAPGALDTAVDLVLTDGNATLPFTNDTVPGVYVSQDNFSLFAMLPAGYGFNASHDRQGVAMYDWQVNSDGVLNLYFMGSEQRVESVTLLDRTRDVVNVVVRESDSSGQGNPATAWYRGFADGFTPNSVPGSYTTVNEPGHLTVFTGDGTGYDLDLVTGVQSDGFTWTVDTDGVLTITDNDDGGMSFVRRLDGSTSDHLKLLIWEMGADGTVDHVAVIDAMRSDDTMTSGVTGSDTALLLAGKTYAMTESGEIALFSFGADGVFNQISQVENQSGEAWTVGEARGAWSFDAAGSLTTSFPGEEASEGVSILQGAGEDFMVVQTDADDSSSVLQVTRVVRAEAALLTGSFSLVNDRDGQSDGTVRMAADFTGTHVSQYGVSTDFTWGISSAGNLVVEIAGDSSFDTLRMTFHLLAGSGGDVLRFVMVNRVNDVLHSHDTSTGQDPDALSVVTFMRN